MTEDEVFARVRTLLDARIQIALAQHGWPADRAHVQIMRWLLMQRAAAIALPTDTPPEAQEAIKKGMTFIETALSGTLLLLRNFFDQYEQEGWIRRWKARRLRGASSPPRPRRSFGRSPCGSSTGWRPEAEGRKAMSHDPAVCLMRWRAMVRRRLELSGVLNGGDDHHDADEWTVSHACYGIATLAADPSGLSLVMHELALSDEQLSRLQAVPLTQCSRADRWRVWESPLAATAEAFAEGITVVQDHLRPEEMPPLPCIPRWIVKAFVQWK